MKQEKTGAKAEKKPKKVISKPKNLFQRMRDIMEEVEYVQKEDKKVNGQYTFVSHDAVTKKIHGALVKHGVVMLPTVVEHIREVGTTVIRGNEVPVYFTTVKVRLTFVNIDDPKDTTEIESFGYGIDPQDKGIGKAVSYACKYGMLKAFCLETGDDPERDTMDFKPSQTGMSEKQCITLVEELMKCPQGTEESLMEWLKIDKLADIPAEKFGAIMDILKKKQAA